MKVLMINSVCGIRSTGRICTDIAQVLENQGHECKIAYGREIVPEKYEKYSYRIGTNLDVKVHAGLSRIFDNAAFHSKRVTKKLIKWIQEYNPDVIHLHNLHGYYLHVGELFRYLKTCNKKIIWTLHDCWVFTGHCAHFDFVGCEKWKTGCFDCPQKNRYPKSVLKDCSKRNYYRKKQLFTGIPDLTIVTPSKWLGELVKQSFLKEYPVEVIYNGIDLEVFKPTESDFRERYNIEDKTLILGVASAWDDRKGLEDFIQLSKLLKEEYRIVLVGVSDEQKKALPPNVIGITRTNNIKELAEIYTAADVFVNLTYEDNYPTVNLEAQACGTPVITYKTGGSVESVSVESVVKKGDLATLIEILQKKEERISFSVGEHFNKIVAVAQYTRLYEE